MVHENIEKIRKHKGVTKTHIAKHLGLSLQGYRHIANGTTRLDVERLRKISEVLDVETSIFFDEQLTDSVIYNHFSNN